MIVAVCTSIYTGLASKAPQWTEAQATSIADTPKLYFGGREAPPKAAAEGGGYGLGVFSIDVACVSVHYAGLEANST